MAEAESQIGNNVENKVIANLEYAEVIKYIESLPPNQATAIRLKYIDEYTLKEIESITGVPAKTVKSRIHEGTKKLRGFLKSDRKGEY